MAIAMTPQQERDFEEKGFVILEDFLTPEELQRLLSAIDEVAAKVRKAAGLGPNEPFAIRNVLAHHEAFPFSNSCALSPLSWSRLAQF